MARHKRMSGKIVSATKARPPVAAARAFDEAAERLSDAGNAALVAAKDMIKARPVMMASFALGLGYVIGAACRATRRR